MRFAIEMADGFPIENMDRYIAGTVYPDSRWVTALDREMTHGDRYRQPDFPRDDFTAGWHVHCLYDHAQSIRYHALLSTRPPAGKDRNWVRLSAAKMIQDMADIRRFDLKRCLQSLDVEENPNGEALGRIQQFNRTLRKTYTTAGGPSLEDYRNLWIGIGLAPAIAADIVLETRKMMADPKLRRRIENTHDEILKQYRRKGSL